MLTGASAPANILRMSAALQVPKSFAVKKREDVTSRLLEIQAKEGGKVPLIDIVYDTSRKEYVVFYYPLKGIGMSVKGA